MWFRQKTAENIKKYFPPCIRLWIACAFPTLPQFFSPRVNCIRLDFLIRIRRIIMTREYKPPPNILGRKYPEQDVAWKNWIDRERSREAAAPAASDSPQAELERRRRNGRVVVKNFFDTHTRIERYVEATIWQNDSGTETYIVEGHVRYYPPGRPGKATGIHVTQDGERHSFSNEQVVFLRSLNRGRYPG
jgi:hypothetical protein